MLPRRVAVVCLLASGCYASRVPAADEASWMDGGAPLDAVTPRLDAAVGLDGAVTSGTATVDETLTCSNGAERWAVLCADAMIVYVSPTGREGAAGSASDPLASPRRAVAHCGERACHLRLVSGVYAVGHDSLYGECLYVEGGGTLGPDGRWTPFAGTASALAGDGTNDSMLGSRNALIVTGVSISNVSTAISVSGAQLLIVDHVSIESATSSGVSVGWSSHGARICNTTIAADYSAVDVSWSSSDVVLDHVDATGGYSGLDVSWSSHDVSVRDSTIRGGYVGLNVSQGAHDVQLKGSVVVTIGDYRP